MPTAFGRVAMKTKGRPLAVMAHLKRSIVEVRAEENCLAHALIIAIARFKKIQITIRIAKDKEYFPPLTIYFRRQASI
jgi:hypothetical protein